MGYLINSSLITDCLYGGGRYPYVIPYKIRCRSISEVSIWKATLLKIVRDNILYDLRLANTFLAYKKSNGHKEKDW